VLNGDDRLCGEILNQLDLLVGEWLHFGAIDGNSPEEVVFFHHRNDYHAPKPGSVYWHLPRFIFKISRLLAHIGDVNGSTSPSASRQGNIRPQFERFARPPFLSCDAGRMTLACGCAERISFAQIQSTVACLTELGSVFQHGLKHWLKIAK